MQHRKPELFESDLPPERLAHYLKKQFIAVDTETRGLNIPRDRLCLVQLCDNEGVVSFVRYRDGSEFERANNLKKLLESEDVLKVIHFARFDYAVMKHYLGADTRPLFCTKIASKLVRTYTDRHSLKDLSRELLVMEMDKSDQMSDWARDDLSDSQLEYAANDVRVLIPIYEKMVALLAREGRTEIAQRCFQALPVVCDLDLKGFRDIFEH
ncbi:MAG TPA: ribonuclease H-like domain-containing protein [Candidatus Obscuribacterales bacterium]